MLMGSSVLRIRKKIVSRAHQLAPEKKKGIGQQFSSTPGLSPPQPFLTSGLNPVKRTHPSFLEHLDPHVLSFSGSRNDGIVVLYFPDEIDAAVNLSFSFRTPSIS